ncbi:Phosphatidylserine/phosphatidylglycerophosphate/cardiolipin synthase [Paracoccus halophilus]|uniref:Phospholipase D n=1 Tax=Paracoccus halophilus TaxID=376733 RepID=A0A099F2P1_9RHOB|nr:phospholipase D family protein [Paracoccus halophilus]KGJ04501.1 phospholipase [Paracoccus halophilus]SFA54575.1 Phosphatidylserine/phosphatidylglycerophosphate/cardiolipin synthase [Paracoccus halophilus]
MWFFLRFLLGLVIAAALAIAILRFVFPLPDISQRAADPALPPDRDTALGQRLAQTGRDQSGPSGILPLASGQDALASRLSLIERAERSIDAQYYIWHDDLSGIILLDALDRAARRGVRVRLLLDDNGVPGLDGFLAALNAQENFQIRLFNPSTVRRPKMAGYAFDFMRMNRRMHNKSMIVDGLAAIIGGRNIGDEYFAISDSFYVDMDALAVGEIVPKAAGVFDDYWNSASVFELESIIAGDGDRAGFDARVAELTDSDSARKLLSDLEDTASRFFAGEVALEWTKVQLVADDPVKGQGKARRDQLMIARLGSILGRIESRLDLVSPYFVPGRLGSDYFRKLRGEGVEIRILTNALNTTDVLLVHSGYTKYRRELLQSGIALHELKLRGGVAPESETQLKPLGLSGASLHAKTFAVDDNRVFIGSFNFDPRSAILNCEMGFLIDSPDMARQIGAGFAGHLARVSYRPELTADGRMVWQETLPSGQVRTWQQEPGATWYQQAALAVIGILPIEWML